VSGYSLAAEHPLQEGELLASVSQWITASIEDTTCNIVIEIEKMAGNETEGLYHLDYGGMLKSHPHNYFRAFG